MAKRKATPLGLGETAWNVLQEALERAFSGQVSESASVGPEFESIIPAEQREHVRIVLEEDSTPTKSYRVGMVIQLAYGIASDAHLNLTNRHPGARGANGVAGRCGAYLRARHAVASVDAYQNIAKNAESLTRGNHPEFDEFLKWISEPERSKEQLRAALNYACLQIALSARPVKTFPDLNGAKLTFAAVMELLNDMLGSASGGAHEQFIVAALLHARVEQEGSRNRVETKRLNASDQSSGSAADVQVKSGTKIDDAFEVTANAWTEKLEAASQIIRSHDLSRLHILAKVDDFSGMIRILKDRQEDISAIDVRAFVSVLVAELRRQFRLSALRRLYDLLDRYQPNVDLVNRYVDRLVQYSLVANA